VTGLADELVRVVDEAAVGLREIGEPLASAKPTADVWSIKEILGHLIDSAGNNQQRFVRAPATDVFVWPGYDQNAWVRVQDHQHRPWSELVELWVLANHQLAHTIRRIPADALAVTCRIGTNDPVTLEFLLHDYLTHLRHHLAQMRERAAR